MNVQQLERKLDRYFNDNVLREQVLESIMDRIRAYNYGNVSLEDIEIYCVILNVGGVKLMTTLKGYIVADMLDKSYIFSRELICTSNWNFKQIFKLSFVDDGNNVAFKIKTLKRKDFQAVLFNVVEPKALTYTVIYRGKEKSYGKVQVDLSYFDTMDYEKYLSCLVDAFHHNSKIKRDGVDETAYKFHIVDYA